ncbi:28S ribosomal protein S23, mitochondrial [Orchesella cincta]|uniref:Small ribosomal subunit protein mS23 n=1 Tax=Orchesella cincta TaxID=48709 RepID=A0A1D2N4D3_ORCCI|nr:28S ribosomal protein S23, mitochondrial [Orchesella cincta]
MAGSRLDRIGTIFSRTTGLMKAGAIKYQDRPLWYDIYRVFPPKYEPHIDREPEKKEINDVLYREDKNRALYFKKFGLNPGGVPRVLGDRNFQEHSQSFIKICLELEKSSPDWEKDKIFDAAVEKYKDQIPYLLDRKRISGDRFDAADTSEGDALNEATASKRHGRKPPIISAQSLLSLFKEAKEKQEKEADQSETKTDVKPSNK